LVSAPFQDVQKPEVSSFQVPELFLPDFPRGWRVILPSAVKIILNWVPLVVEAVNGLPSKKVVWRSRQGTHRKKKIAVGNERK
jgi:hypothetical protein